jgi:hypothetical protein
MGGSNPAAVAVTEEYDGTNWTSVNSLNTARLNLAGAGIQTAAIAFGGSPAPGTNTGATELYDGTSWTTSPVSMNTARRSLAGAGTQTLALGFGGQEQLIQQQQKNGQVQHQQQLQSQLLNH